MVFLLDFLTLVFPLIITFVLYKLYYKVFIKGYVKKIKQADEDGEAAKAERMRALALKRQPKKMKRLLKQL